MVWTRPVAPAVVSTTGNPDVHIILRGGVDRPNYQAEHIAAAIGALENAAMPPLVMVDASHGNSRKDHERQAVSPGRPPLRSATDSAASSV